jgi:GDP-L-fucose synthase
MKIVLTGANGFIGRNVKEYLSPKHEIICLSHKQIDLTDASAVLAFLEHEKPDAVIHAAAKPGHRKATDRENLTQINLAMFVALFEGAKRCGAKKFIHFGSGSEFDMLSRPLQNVTEEEIGQMIPHDETGFPRYVENKLLTAANYGYNLRCFGVFGKYEDYTLRFISNTVCKALLSLPITIREDKTFSFLSVWDLCRLVERFLINDLPCGDYNAVPTETVTMREIVRQILAETESSSTLTIEGCGHDYTGSNQKLLSVLPDFTFTPFKQSLCDLIAYYKTIINTIEKESL